MCKYEHWISINAIATKLIHGCYYLYMVSYSVTMLTRSKCISQTKESDYITRAKSRLQRDVQYNTQLRDNITYETYEVNIDFDDASREWNRNKRRVGQMYEYISPASPVKMCSSNNRRYNTRSSKQSS